METENREISAWLPKMPCNKYKQRFVKDRDEHVIYSVCQLE